MRCKSCEIWSQRKDHPKHTEWEAMHNGQVNHCGSSGSMESVGAIQMFHRSIEKHKLKYTKYLGDGDSSSFQDVVKSTPYGKDVVIEKYECIGHIQKRVGSRCRALRKSLSGKKLSDGKGISGKGRLTDKAITTLQNYYGMAIRHNTGNLPAMRKAIGAVLYHCSDIKDETVRHQFCPKSDNSWCKWRSDKIKGKAQYKNKINLPTAVENELFPIFQDLSSEGLLSKCLHGQTQNVNEALNHIIWKKCPKSDFVKRDTLHMSVCSAVIDFNNGKHGICKVAEELGLEVGSLMMNRALDADRERILNIKRKSTCKVKKARKKLRAIKKGYEDKEKEEEGKDSYASGSF